LQREQEKKDKLEEERVKEERRIVEEERAYRLKFEEEKLRREEDERKEKLKLEAEEGKEKLRIDEEERKEKLRLDEEERKERLRLEEEDKIRKAKVEENERNRQYQLEELQRTRIQAQNGTVHGGNGGKEKRKYVIEIGKWKPEITDLNTFLCNFETSATALEVTGEIKALELTRCLEGTALELIQNLSQEERLDYEAIKRILQQRYRYTEGYYRKQFKTARTRPGESQKSLVDRTKTYLKRWVELSGLEMSVEGLTELFVKDKLFSQPEQRDTNIPERSGKTEFE